MSWSKRSVATLVGALAALSALVLVWRAAAGPADEDWPGQWLLPERYEALWAGDEEPGLVPPPM